MQDWACVIPDTYEAGWQGFPGTESHLLVDFGAVFRSWHVQRIDVKKWLVYGVSQGRRSRQVAGFHPSADMRR